jgi:hypothetical protein
VLPVVGPGYPIRITDGPMTLAIEWPHDPGDLDHAALRVAP